MSLPLEEGYRSAMQKLALGEREGAIRLLQELARQAPEDTRFHMALEAALAARHRAMRTEMSSASTQELMAEALKLKETNELRTAIRFIKRRKWPEADRALSASLADREEQAEKLILLALVRSRGRQQHRKALTPVQRAVALLPARQDALYLLEEIHLAVAQPEQARAARLRAWERAGGDPSKRKEARKRLHRFIADPRAAPAAEEFEPETEEAPLPIPALPPPSPATLPLDRIRMVILSAILMTSIALIGTILHAQQPEGIDIAPFSTALPFTHGAEHAPGQVVLWIEVIAWQELSRQQQRDHASSLMQIATAQGYTSIYIHSPQEQLLASVREGRVFLPDPATGVPP